MKTITLPSGTYAVDDLLNGFEIKQLPSRNVQFIGINVFELSLYVQFLSGSAYLYKNIDMDTLQEAETCESIGKFVSAEIVKKFPAEKQERLLITEIPDQDFILIDDPLHPSKIKPEDVGEFHTRYAETLAKHHGIDLGTEPKF